MAWPLIRVDDRRRPFFGNNRFAYSVHRHNTTQSLVPRIYDAKAEPGRSDLEKTAPSGELEFSSRPN